MLVSLVVYAGASQFLLISLLTSGAGLVTAVPAVLLMNARHALYGPALVARGSQRSSRLSSPWLAFGLTDEVFATALSRISSIPPQHRDHWLLGLQVGAYVAWVAGTAIGVVFVRDVENWPAAVREGLAFVLPALFFSLLLDTGLRRWRFCRSSWLREFQRCLVCSWQATTRWHWACWRAHFHTLCSRVFPDERDALDHSGLRYRHLPASLGAAVARSAPQAEAYCRLDGPTMAGGCRPVSYLRTVRRLRLGTAAYR
ncbi:AzlC family ABC transporter permease [Stenotrophomonas sp. ISL-67]|nr:AzlC family ABC transporter permease [Stenotrophomonas sp. ISL-67]